MRKHAFFLMILFFLLGGLPQGWAFPTSAQFRTEAEWYNYDWHVDFANIQQGRQTIDEMFAHGGLDDYLHGFDWARVGEAVERAQEAIRTCDITDFSQASTSLWSIEAELAREKDQLDFFLNSIRRDFNRVQQEFKDAMPEFSHVGEQIRDTSDVRIWGLSPSVFAASVMDEVMEGLGLEGAGYFTSKGTPIGRALGLFLDAGQLGKLLPETLWKLPADMRMLLETKEMLIYLNYLMARYEKFEEDLKAISDDLESTFDADACETCGPEGN